jgi:hypothetical protein
VTSSGPPSGYREDTYPIAPGHLSHPEVIGRGMLGGNSWTLLADVSGNGQLCMGITWHPSGGPQQYGCGFGSNTVNDEGRGTEPTATAQAQDGSALVYAPAPADAVRATLTTPAIPGTPCETDTMRPETVRITHRLPDWYARPKAGWFETEIPPTAANCVIDVRFIDTRGHTLKQPNNF